jgi:hypothetical protein
VKHFREFVPPQLGVKVQNLVLQQKIATLHFRRCEMLYCLFRRAGGCQQTGTVSGIRGHEFYR